MANLPTHIGYIVDGNRRWAKAHGKTAREGHEAGRVVLRDVLLDTIAAGVPYVSAYVFSTENWKRSTAEVNWLMTLIIRVLREDLHYFIEQNIRVRILGSRERLSARVLTAIEDAERQTAHLTGGQALVCLNYGGHQEVVDAVRQIVAEGIPEDQIDQQVIAGHLYTPDVPACDIVVRTSGERRLSNFMLWRSAYSELMFLDKHWPDMTKQDVHAILEEYNNRARRFGG
ncbi:MAG TPA: polyprenyl diphosphate synthase [Candidatus Saccharimonas sp.]|nr:polyprenyl diphosphate synthase [Candidatus Saccharimonas sp.]